MGKIGNAENKAPHHGVLSTQSPSQWLCLTKSCRQPMLIRRVVLPGGFFRSPLPGRRGRLGALGRRRIFDISIRPQANPD